MDEEWKMNESGNNGESDDDPTALDSRLALGENEEEEAAAAAATRLSDTDSEPGGGGGGGRRPHGHHRPSAAPL